MILERNPELEFQDKVDLDKLVKEAFLDFQKDQSRLKGMEKEVSKMAAVEGTMKLQLACDRLIRFPRQEINKLFAILWPIPH